MHYASTSQPRYLPKGNTNGWTNGKEFQRITLALTGITPAQKQVDNDVVPAVEHF
jgi:hypothetical protein